MKIAIPALACQRARADVFAFSPRIGAVLCASSAVLLGQMTLVAGADPISSGKAAFAVCSTCHSLSSEGNSGPPLNGLVGRKAGAVPAFNYSSAMKDSDITWDPQTLDRFLANPQQQVPGNRMPFPGIPDESKRADIIAYLATFK
jgi:cytochrome c2